MSSSRIRTGPASRCGYFFTLSSDTLLGGLYSRLKFISPNSIPGYSGVASNRALLHLILRSDCSYHRETACLIWLSYLLTGCVLTGTTRESDIDILALSSCCGPKRVYTGRSRDRMRFWRKWGRKRGKLVRLRDVGGPEKAWGGPVDNQWGTRVLVTEFIDRRIREAEEDRLQKTVVWWFFKTYPNPQSSLSFYLYS